MDEKFRDGQLGGRFFGLKRVEWESEMYQKYSRADWFCISCCIIKPNFALHLLVLKNIGCLLDNELLLYSSSKPAGLIRFNTIVDTSSVGNYLYADV